MILNQVKPGQRVRLRDGREYVVSAGCWGDVWARAVITDESGALVCCHDKNDVPLGEIEVVHGDQEVTLA